MLPAVHEHVECSVFTCRVVYYFNLTAIKLMDTLFASRGALHCGAGFVLALVRVWLLRSICVGLLF